MLYRSRPTRRQKRRASDARSSIAAIAAAEVVAEVVVARTGEVDAMTENSTAGPEAEWAVAVVAVGPGRRPRLDIVIIGIAETVETVVQYAVEVAVGIATSLGIGGADTGMIDDEKQQLAPHPPTRSRRGPVLEFPAETVATGLATALTLLPPDEARVRGPPLRTEIRARDQDLRDAVDEVDGVVERHGVEPDPCPLRGNIHPRSGEDIPRRAVDPEIADGITPALPRRRPLPLLVLLAHEVARLPVVLSRPLPGAALRLTRLAAMAGEAGAH